MNIVVVYGGIYRNTFALSDTFRPSAHHCFELTSRTKYLNTVPQSWPPNIFLIVYLLHENIRSKFLKGKNSIYVCKHLIAACIQTQSNLPGLVQLPKKFKIVRRKKTSRYIDDSRDEDQISAVDNQLIEQITLEPIEPVVHVAVPIA